MSKSRQVSAKPALDPYAQWLGIPPREQPPTHYRLLGIDPFESDAATIEAAADRQMARVRRRQLGKHAGRSQELLNEISAAKTCLLNDRDRQQYDDSLRAANDSEVTEKSASAALAETTVFRSDSTKSIKPPAVSRWKEEPDDPPASAKPAPAKPAAAPRRSMVPLIAVAAGASCSAMAALVLLFVVAWFAMTVDERSSDGGAVAVASEDVTATNTSRSSAAPEIPELDSPSFFPDVESSDDSGELRDEETNPPLPPADATEEADQRDVRSDRPTPPLPSPLPDRREEVALAVANSDPYQPPPHAEPASPREVRRLPPAEVLTRFRQTVQSVAFSADNESVLVAGRDKVFMLLERSGDRYRHFVGHTDWVMQAHFLPEDEKIITAGWDGTARVWDTASGRELARLNHVSPIVSVAAAPQRGILVAGDWDGVIHTWNLAERESKEIGRSKQEGAVMALQLLPDGRRIVTGDWSNALQLWNLRDENGLVRFDGHTDRIMDLALGAGGDLFSAAHDGTVRRWDLDSGKEIRRYAGHEGAVQAIALSPDGSRLVSGGRDHTVRLWDVHTGEPLARLTGPRDVVWTVAFSPDGQSIAAGGADTKVYIWAVP